MKITYAIWGMIPTIGLSQLGAAMYETSPSLAWTLVILGVASLVGQLTSLYRMVKSDF